MHLTLSTKCCIVALGIALAGLCGQNATAQTPENMIEITRFLDDHGRTFIPQGFVANTHVRDAKVDYLPSDYQQMARYGANFQVIRIGLGRLGGWPGRAAEPGYLEQIDTMIERGAAVGIQSGIKLVVYDIKGFREGGWEALWKDEHGEQDQFLAAWRSIWERHIDDPNVFSYDLLNEPMLGGFEDPEVLEREVLAPLYRKLIDGLQAIDSKTWACFQPIHTEPKVDVFSAFAPWHVPLDRERIIYAPHIYEGNLKEIPQRLDAYAREANLSHAKMLLGEWGPPTAKAWDSDWEGQVACKRLYDTTCREVDARSIGTVKAWFSGTTAWYGGGGGATWAIFQDEEELGTIERKFILDYLCRPRPLAVAGDVRQFEFNFPTRTFTMRYVPRPASAPTEIYIPVNRHYPDGFRLKINGTTIFELQITPETTNGQRPTMIAGDSEGRRVTWEPWAQRLMLHESLPNPEEQQLVVSPGFSRAE